MAMAVGVEAPMLADGEWSDADDIFKPLHTAQPVERCPEIPKFLDLPSDSRFLIAPGYEDIWTDESLLDVWVWKEALERASDLRKLCGRYWV